MDVYPLNLNLNLILATATATASVFLGFLPTKSIRSAFFAQQTLSLGIAWILIAITSPPAILHYPLIIALLSLASWWHFRRDNAFTAKMWLSLASGLGISLGVMLILAVTPRAYPPGLPESSRMLLLASIYLGGAVIGLAGVCYLLAKSAALNSGVTSALVQRHAGLLLLLVIARAVLLVSGLFLPSEATGPDIRIEAALLFALALIVLPTLAGMALRAACTRTGGNSASLFLAVGLAGILSEILARLLVL